MADPTDDLVARWKQNPSAPATIALCDSLRADSARGALVQQVGEFAAQRHSGDVGVLLSVARMYLEARRYPEAQGVLVGAGKIAPRDADIYRWLGEVLLRRGDADRAEKVLERALQLGTRDTDARLWLERARVFRPMQAKAGARAVASEVAQATERAASSPEMREPMESFGDTTTIVRDIPTEVRPASRSDAGSKPSYASAPRMSAGTGANMFDVPRSPLGGVRRASSSGASFEPTHSKDLDTADAFEPFDPPTLQRPPSVDVEISVEAPLPVAPPAPRAPPQRAAPAPPAPSNRPPPQSSRPPPMPAPARTREPSANGEHEADGRMVPLPRDVLDALALAGVFEPPTGGATGATAWDRPDKSRARKRASILVSIASVLLIGAGVGSFYWVRAQRAKAHLEAEIVLDKVEDDLHKSRPELLAGSEKAIGRAFELESRSERAAVDWLHERALMGLLRGGGDVAFESSAQRAREVGVKEDRIAFSQVASFLFQGDTAGAAALLPKWDAPSANDPWYQLLAGATLERAGDARAQGRFAAAAKLDPKLVVAEIALARSTAIDGDAQQAGELAKQFRAKYPDRVEGAALIALSWARDPGRGEQPPTEADEVAKRASELPISLAFVPPALDAVRAVDKHAMDDAKTHIEKGLAVADGPGVAAWLGSVAISAGNEQLARKAALVAVSFSAVYPPARVLAARVALLGDRLDEALKATEELDANSPDVAVVRAAAAYERMDADALSRALDAVSADAKKLPFLQPLTASAFVLAGKSALSPKDALEMSDDDAPWADLVTIDLALDRGDVDLASAIAQRWKTTGDARPLRAVRLARLMRYKGDPQSLEAADKLSSIAIERGTVTVRVLLERAFVLAARGRATEVGPLLAKFPLVLGPLTTWVNAYAIAMAGKVDDAKGKTSSVDPPPALAPFDARILGAMALGAMKDKKRGVEYVTQLLASGSQNPDLTAAATALGFKRIESKGKQPLRYEAP